MSDQPERREQLSLLARPRTIDALIGQDKLIKKIRGHIANGVMPKAWLLLGPKGTGKTTLARILATSFQCPHQTDFGRPCKECYDSRSSLDVYEINAAKVTGIREIESELAGSDYMPRSGNYRVYILDEAHRMSAAAQDLALKYLEDSPETTKFVLCSTKPEKLIETLRSRCMGFKLQELEHDSILALVEKMLKRVASKLPADRLAHALTDKNVGSARLIAHAVESYIAGSTPEDAVKDVDYSVDANKLTKAILKGDWAMCATILSDTMAADANAMRLSTVAYLRTVLWNSDVGDRAETVANAISILCGVSNAEDLVMSAQISATVYQCTQLFSKYKQGTL